VGAGVPDRRRLEAGARSAREGEGGDSGRRAGVRQEVHQEPPGDGGGRPAEDRLGDLRSDVKPVAVEEIEVVEDFSSTGRCDEGGEEGLRRRAAEEAREEAGLALDPASIELLGAPFFVAPGIVSEKIFLTAADATGVAQREPEGDGSPLEEGCKTRWLPIEQA